ncbi:MAG: PrsW family intramembrane metalloprotease [Streptosporangiales bacterium]|nr:PrsW family intramembrane metalloprotease [Streptosporangiales bacterium]
MHLRWLAVLAAGLALFVAVLAVLLDTGNPLYVPSLLLIGAVVAGQLEFETVRELGALPTLLIGLIEESAKLAVPAVMLAVTLTRLRPRAMDGLVLGVAVGSGFAALETMGYAFVALLRAGGHLEPVTILLLLRAVTSPGGHAAWTGLVCAALFAIWGASRGWLAWLRFLLVFVGVVVLHAAWDSTAGGSGHLIVGGLSFALLMVVTWRLHRAARTNGPER